MNLIPEWQEKFRAHSIKIGFALTLTRPMLEFLCAVADDVQWDRLLYFQTGGLGHPECSITTAHSLVKRGLIDKQPREDVAAKRKQKQREANEKAGHFRALTWEEICQTSHWVLTPAGRALVELLKVGGLFVEADMAIAKKNKKHA